MRNLALSVALILVPILPLVAGDSVNFDREIRPMMVKYCVDCHSSKKPKGELNLAAISDEATALKSRKVWVEIQKRVHQREMPPEDAPQPSSAEIERLSNWAAATVKRIDAATPPQPGRVTMRRLNRVEYRNTIHDLLGVTFDLGWDPTRDFPADGAG